MDDRRQHSRHTTQLNIEALDLHSGRRLGRVVDLSEDGSPETALIFGELYRAGTEWKFKAVGQGFRGGLGPLAKSFGVNIG